MTARVALSVVAVEKRNSVDFLSSLFAAYGHGEPVALVEPTVGAPDIPGAACRRLIRTKAGGGWFARSAALPRTEDPAHIAFTSGTTGAAKAIVLSHAALADVTDRLSEVMRTDGAIREYVGAPVYYSFGLARVRAATSVGGAAYVPANGFDPLELVRMLREGEANAFSAVPTLMRVVLENADLFRPVGERVRWIEIGSQYMARSEKEKTKALFPQARIVQHYGLTEASRSTFLTIDDTQGESLESVGRARGAVEISLADDGRIRIRGPHVALGVLTADGVAPLTDDQGWLTTSDLGRLDRGELYFEGRADDVINVGGVKIAPELLERRIAATVAPGLSFAVGRMRDAMRGEALLIAVETPGADLDAVRKSGVAAASTLGLEAAGAVRAIAVASLPRTDTGKIRRGALEALAPATTVAAPSAADTPFDTAEFSPREAEIAAIWKAALGVERLSPSASFFDLGGDSLSAINVIMRMERLGVDRSLARQILEGRTIREIAAAPATTGGARSSASIAAEGVNAARGALMAALIAGHWLPFFLLRLQDGEALLRLANPFLRIGTPCFAIMYGLALGLYQYPLFLSNRPLFRRNQLFSLGLVGGGALLAAGLEFARAANAGKADDPRLAAELFYGVLLFYFISIATIGVLFRLMSIGGRPIVAALVLAAGLFAVEALVDHFVGDAFLTGIVELARLMAVAKYNVFGMSGIAFLGVAMGLWLRERRDRADVARKIGVGGAVIGATGVFLSVASGGGAAWFDARTATLPMIISYVGLVGLAVGAMIGAARRWERPGAPRTIVRALAVVGVMSLFLYVGHGLVIPGKEFLVELGLLSNGLAILLTVGVFFAAAAIGARRLYRIYYG